MLVWIEETTDDMIELAGSAVCSPTSLMCLLARVLLVEVLLAEVLPLAALLAVEEMVLAESLFLGEKERIPPEWEIPEEEEEEEELPLSGAWFVPWYSWYLFSSAGWTGGHRHLGF